MIRFLMTQSYTTSENILIADDEPENLIVLKQILSERGYRVRPALNRELAIKSIQNSDSDQKDRGKNSTGDCRKISYSDCRNFSHSHCRKISHKYKTDKNKRTTADKAEPQSLPPFPEKVMKVLRLEK